MKSKQAKERYYVSTFVMLICLFFCFFKTDSFASEIEKDYAGYVFWADSVEEALNVSEKYDSRLVSFSDGIGIIETDEEIEDEGLYPNFLYSVEKFSWDQSKNLQWHIGALNMAGAYKISTGKGIKVAVIDTGIDTENEAFTGRIGLADTVIPESAYGGTGFSLSYKGVKDNLGHGTHVAGIIGAKSSDSSLMGIAPNCEIYSIKALEKNGISGTGYTSWIATAILRAVEADVDVINMSLGGGSRKDEFVAEAIEIAVEHGCVVVCAAGNYKGSGVQGTVDYPASDENTIAVSSVKENLADFQFDLSYSKYGSEITISAPGTSILSTGIDGSVAYSGTSMACGVISGTAALLLQLEDDLSINEIKNYICDSALDLGDVGWDEYYGYGVVQPAEALKNLKADIKAREPKPEPKPEPEPEPVPEPEPDPEPEPVIEVADTPKDLPVSNTEEQSDISDLSEEEKIEALKDKLESIDPEDEIEYSIQSDIEETEVPVDEIKEETIPSVLQNESGIT